MSDKPISKTRIKSEIQHLKYMSGRQYSPEISYAASIARQALLWIAGESDISAVSRLREAQRVVDLCRQEPSEKSE